MGFDRSVSRATQLRILAALVAGHAHPRAIHPAHWEGLATLALHHGLGPLLLWRVQAAGEGEALGAALEMLRAARARDSVQHLLAQKSQDRIQQALAAAGIPCLWLKGIVLAEMNYPAPELRPMVDLDLLVPYARRKEALDVLQQAGYRLLPQLFDGTEALKHHFALHGPEGDKALVELHFRLLGAADRLLSLAGVEWFWQQAISFGSTSADGRVTLRPEAHWLYLAAHALLQHGEADLRLLRYYDLHQLIVTTTPFDWGLLSAGAKRLGWTDVAARALHLTQRYFATPLPAGWVQGLDSDGLSNAMQAHMQRRRGVRTLSERVIHDLITMGWDARLRAAQRILLPPPSYMRRRYAVSDPWRLPAAYWARWQHMARDAWQTLRRKGVRHG